MIFTQKFEKYGQTFFVKMISQKEVEGLAEMKDEDMYSFLQSIILDEKQKPLFKNADDVKGSLPPSVMTEIINMSAGVEKKSI